MLIILLSSLAFFNIYLWFILASFQLTKTDFNSFSCYLFVLHCETKSFLMVKHIKPHTTAL